MTRATGSYAGLTRRQADLLSFIRERAAEGETPSYDEMRAAVGLDSKSGAFRLVDALVERGYVERIRYRARSIRLVTEPTLSKATIEQLIKELKDRGVIIEGARR